MLWNKWKHWKQAGNGPGHALPCMQGALVPSSQDFDFYPPVRQSRFIIRVAFIHSNQPHYLPSPSHPQRHLFYRDFQNASSMLPYVLPP